MKKLSALRLLAAALASSLLLAACGGGGGGGDGSAIPSTTPLGPSAQYAGVCTLDAQKNFVRSYLDEVYLWYDEIRYVDPAAFTDVRAYFDALLVKPKDRFSAVLPTGAADSTLSQSFPAPLRAGLDTALANHTNTVPRVRVDTTASGRRVGYLRFDDHDTGAQDDLITAFRQVRDGGAQDLILDLRFNSGGFLYIAQTAASMIAGPDDDGKVFEQLRYNNKRQAESASSTLLFSRSVQFPEVQYPRGTALPQLDLPRLYVLTSGTTCSASESIINSLRGIDVQVVLVGATTCGKPYGFHRKDNCGLAYFPIEFQGTNARGFGDYTTGFAPTCSVADNPAANTGDPADPLYAAALVHIETGACPPGTATARASGAARAGAAQPSRPAWAGRLLGTPR